MIRVNWYHLVSFIILGLLLMFLAGFMMTSGCTAPKGLKLVKKVPVTIPTPAPTITEMPIVTISHRVVYPVVTENPLDFMYRTSGRYLGESYGWRRDDVSGTKDMVVNVSVYDYEFMPSYQWWHIGNGKYVWQSAPAGMKYLFVFIRMNLEQGPALYAWVGKYAVRYNGVSYGLDPEHQEGVRIREMETHQTEQGTEPFDLGWVRYYEDNHEKYIRQEYIKEGKSNGMDGYLIYVVPKEARPEDVVVLANYDHLGGQAWWKLTSRI
jgi:hypothetical protein